MSFDTVPPKSEVMGWSPNHLAEFLRKMKLSGCDKVVLQSSMNGPRFLNMTENDIQKFPKLHAPLISKICSEMNKKEERRGLFVKKTPTPKFREPDIPVEGIGWGEDEFESDDDYEDPDREEEEDEGSVGDYESPTEEQDENDYEPNPSDAAEDFPAMVRPSLPIGEGDYIDNVKNQSRGPPPTPSPRPLASTHLAPPHQVPSLERREHSPYRDKSPGRAMGPMPPKVERNKKPTRERDHPGPAQGGNLNSMERPSTHSLRNQEKNPRPAWSKPSIPPGSSASVGRSNTTVKPPASRFPSEARSDTQNQGQFQAPVPRNHTFPLKGKGLPPRPGLPGPPSRHTESLPPNIPPSLPQMTFGPHITKSASVVARSASSVGRSQHPAPPQIGLKGLSPHTTAPHRTQNMDPSWYVGEIARNEADHCLRRKQEDGAYLVRDSTKQQSDQPFTLMVLYQDKVYNIKIRMQNQQYLLGTGMKVKEAFPTVRAMISHYNQTPLLLIDAKNRGTAQQNQCFLSYPAGYGAT